MATGLPLHAPMSRAFTLIELLVVVAIIAILAAIAVPNLLEAMTRAKVSRTASDMRTIDVALNAYAVDWNTFPPDGNGPPYRGLIALTTPIAYQTSMRPDVFNMGFVDGYATTPAPIGDEDEEGIARLLELGTGNPGGPLIRFPASTWALASYGPDIDDDTRNVGEYPFTRLARPYDTTNGTVSDGDLYRLGPATEHPNFASDANPVTF